MRQIPPHHALRTPLLESLEPRLLLSTWYVRPYGGNTVTYGAENGTSYADAWDGFSKIAWGPGGVQAGDTLYVCGTHPSPVRAMSGAYVASDSQLKIGASGTGEDARITIRGDYPGDSGQILREQVQYMFDSSNPALDGWSGPDAYGVYSRGNAYYSIGSPIELDVATRNVYTLKTATAIPLRRSVPMDRLRHRVQGGPATCIITSLAPRRPCQWSTSRGLMKPLFSTTWIMSR